MLDKHTSPHISYAQLREILNSFGFEQKVTSTYTAFREGSHDAVIMLPLMANYETVSDAHLITVVNTIIGKGIASEESFASRFQEATLSDKNLPVGTLSPINAPKKNTRFVGMTTASKALADARTASASKFAAGSALSQINAPAKTTSAKAAAAVAKTLDSKETGVKSKTAAASALSITQSAKSSAISQSGKANIEKPSASANMPTVESAKRKKK